MGVPARLMARFQIVVRPRRSASILGDHDGGVGGQNLIGVDGLLAPAAAGNSHGSLLLRSKVQNVA